MRLSRTPLLRQFRRGAVLMECVLAIGIILVAVVLLAQVMGLIAQQRRLAEQRRLAQEEVANRLERAALLPWSELTSEKIESLSWGQEVRSALPEARLSALVRDEEQPAARRIDVQLVWKNRAGIEVEPVVLSMWRHRRREEAP